MIDERVKVTNLKGIPTSILIWVSEYSLCKFEQIYTLLLWSPKVWNN